MPPHSPCQIRLAAWPLSWPLLWVAVLLATAGVAQAQSIGDWNGTYRAQPATAAPPRIEPSPTVTPTPKARPHDHAFTVHPAKKPHPKTPAALPKPMPTPTPTLKQAVTPTLAPGPAPTPPPPVPKPAAIPAPSPEPRPAPRPVATAQRAPLSAPLSPPRQDLPQWPLGLAALLGGAAGWALWRRKSAPDIPVDEPAPPPPPPPPPFAQQPPAAPMASEPEPEREPELILDLVPTRFATTLTEAILRYDLTLTNHTGQPLGPLIIAGAMEATGPGEQDNTPAAQTHSPSFRPAPGFSPHPHFTPDPILAPAAPEPNTPAAPSGPLPELHRLLHLPMGESVRVQGQLRLPLSGITPIRLGGAALFVPVVRVQVEATGAGDGTGDDTIIATGLCMVVGQAPQPPSHGGQAPLGPFRLDAGPTIARHLAMRAMAPDMPLNAAI